MLNALAERRSVAALEFALVAPMMISLLLGGYDVSRGLVIWEQTFAAARAVVEAAEKKSVQPDGTFVISAADAEAAMTSIYAEMPGLPSLGNTIGTYPGTYSVTLSSVVLTPAGCSIENASACTATPAWSVELQEGRPGRLLVDPVHLRRQCGTALGFVATFPEDSSTLTKIPLSAVTLQSPLLVADVQYNYTPAFLQFMGQIVFWASAAFPVPGGNTTTDYVQYSPANDPNVCAGYP